MSRYTNSYKAAFPGTRRTPHDVNNVIGHPNHLKDLHERELDASTQLWFLRGTLKFPFPGKGRSNGKSKVEIPEPRNSFYICRSFVMNAGVLSPDLPQKTFLKIVGYLWHGFPQQERDRFIQMLPEERRLHQLRYPQYVPPTGQPRTRTRKVPTIPDDEDPKGFHNLACMGVAELILRNIQGAELHAGIKALMKTGLGVGGHNLSAAYISRRQGYISGAGMQGSLPVVHVATQPANILSGGESDYFTSQSSLGSSRMSMTGSTHTSSGSRNASYAESATGFDWNMDASTQDRAFDIVDEFDHYQYQEDPFAMEDSYDAYQAVYPDGVSDYTSVNHSDYHAQGSTAMQGGHSPHAYLSQSHSHRAHEESYGIPTHLLR